MTGVVRVTRAAEADIKHAAAWYGEHSPAAALGFLAAVKETVERISQNPMQYQAIIDQSRRANLSRYPYGLWYVPEGKDGALVFACLHHKRDPKTPQARKLGL